jgi:hypothetical protein
MPKPKAKRSDKSAPADLKPKPDAQTDRHESRFVWKMDDIVILKDGQFTSRMKRKAN